ncbi:hypothetical protein ASG89_14650 [Paenibacillus sp. Soil766]|uniref:glycoside hydrolase family 28 protein n=1 Tax=Paenibacillus sp. Soil766 TaxID=1736404 RepID=UPI000708B91A|nr:glycoside hydrolase family 28 protein [Paenibacillus sp. Soil766]KRE82493.1 hypothetical protein ASG89_14650 [Paenibacillus sp. Soil766]
MEGQESSVRASSPVMTWDMAEEILSRIHNPVFSDNKVNVMDFGAKSDGTTLDTPAFEKAIRHMHEHGGGTVIVPKGTYLIGSIELLSHVNLHLEDEDTVLKFTTEINERNYPIAYGHWEASPAYNYRALIYAYRASNIALTGKGTLDGQASADVWWNWKHQIEHTWSESKVSLQEKASNQLRDMNNAGVPVEKRVFGHGSYLRPNFIQPLYCENVLLEGVTLINSPMWQVNPVLCKNVIVRNMTLRSHGANNDGVDPESCMDVLIEGNMFDSGDDCISLKSGRDLDGRTLNAPCQNIVIRNNTFADGHGGIALGSEMSGGIKNIFADDNHFDSMNLTYPLRLKTNARRGGKIENVYLRNSVIETVNQATIHGTMFYAEGRDGEFLPAFNNIVVENVKSNGGQYGIFLEAFEEVPITGLSLRNIEITNVINPIRALNWGKEVLLENVTINGEAYPRPTEARILGVPAPSVLLHATALLIGDDIDKLTYTWFMADRRDGDYSPVGIGPTFTVPEDVIGMFVKVGASDVRGSVKISIPYEVLATVNAAWLPENSPIASAVNRIASKGFINQDMAFDPEGLITRIEIARMLARMWKLTAPTHKLVIADMDNSDPDYNVAAAVIEQGMMALHKSSFRPNETITREEIASVAMMSCGVSFKNASTIYDSTFQDGKEIGDIYLTNVERSCFFSFMTGTEDRIFSPKRNVTYAEVITILDRISDFAGM